MIASMIRAALGQRLIVVVLALVVFATYNDILRLI
jgi:hypothetical protein